ncbi:MAG: flagellar motor protein MotB [Silvanigrellaceae bacterium]
MSNYGEHPDNHSSTLHEEVEEGEPWLVSYADMMTLLFGFFVLMYTFAVSRLDDEGDNWVRVRKELAAFFGGEKGADSDNKQNGNSKDLFSPNVGIESSSNTGSKKQSSGIFEDAKTDAELKEIDDEEAFKNGFAAGTYVSSGKDLSKTDIGGALKLRKIADSEDSLELIISDNVLFGGKNSSFLPEGEAALAKVCQRISGIKFPFFLGVSSFSQNSAGTQGKPASYHFPTSESFQRANQVLQKLSQCPAAQAQGSRLSAMAVGHIPMSQTMKGVLESGVIIRIHVAMDF